jgi:SAM-dependent methyltransferase
MSESSTYDVRSYWSGVADEISARGRDELLAGDNDPVSALRRDAFLERFLAAVPASGCSVLELGCGPGGNLVELSARHPSRLVGCDASPSMLELAARNIGHEHIELREIDGRTLPFEDREFDTSLTVTVLHHNQDEQFAQILAELCRVTSRTVVLIESTGWPARHHFSYARRLVADYERVAGANGFRLARKQPIGLAASEAMAMVVGRSLRLGRRLLGAPAWTEGASLPAPVQSLMTTSMRITARLDRYVPQRRGLTMMIFERRSGSA